MMGRQVLAHIRHGCGAVWSPGHERLAVSELHAYDLGVRDELC